MSPGGGGQDHRLLHNHPSYLWQLLYEVGLPQSKYIMFIVIQRIFGIPESNTQDGGAVQFEFLASFLVTIEKVRSLYI